jgi:N-acetylmuramoyl-L-alanine amidase
MEEGVDASFPSLVSCSRGRYARARVTFLRTIVLALSMPVPLLAFAPRASATSWPASVPPIVSIERRGAHVRAVVDARGGLTEASLEAASRALILRLEGEGARHIELLARDEAGRLVPADSLVPAPPPVPRRRSELPRRRPFLLRGDEARRPRVLRSGPPADAPGQTRGFLTGKTVYLSAGHGWTWRSEPDAFSTQRGNTWDIVEDLVSAEVVNQYLVPYLLNAGAIVFTVRERDLQEAMLIVDDADAGYSESGAGFRASAAVGFASGRAPYSGSANPMRLGATRELTTTAAVTSSARWTPTLTSAGDYAVYVSYAAGADRAPDAHYIVFHKGGETHFRVDQRRHGNTWVYLGTFWFDVGADPLRGSLVLQNDSETPGAILSLDAARFGGGRGDITRGSATSGKRRWEEASRYYAQFSGAPATVYDGSTTDGNDDVGTRSRMAAWLHEDGEDALYLAWHTNAPRPGRGTSTYVYGPNPPDGSYTFTGTMGSDRLARLVHDEIVGDIRALVDPAWRDRGVFSAYFGEVNPRHNSEMPAALVEVAFHDTEADATVLKEPRFRQLVARAMYQGIARYFAERDRVPAKLLPEPPTHVVVRNAGEGRVDVSWRAGPSGGALGDGATGYRVYTSRDGRAWDNGEAVAATRHTLSGRPRGETVFVRVTSTNDGGESFPTPTLAARLAESGSPALLFVFAFDRLDASALVREETPGLGTVHRMLLSRMNRYDAVIAHAVAAAAAGLSFDSAHSHAVGEGDVALSPYRAVAWMAGEESTADEAMSSAEQGKLREHAAVGGVVFASGAEIAWDLGARGTGEDPAFLRDVLRATYGADDVPSAEIVGEGAFSDLAALTIDDGSLGTYEVGFPDVLVPSPGAVPALSYAGTSGTAAVFAPGAAFFLGAPFEALYPVEARNALFVRAMSLLGVRDGPAPGGTPDAGASVDGGTRAPSDGGPPVAPPGGCACDASSESVALTALLPWFMWIARRRRGGRRELRRVRPVR